MDLNARAVYKAIQSKGVTRLYHANTVRTSCTFLREGALLARGVVEERGLDQTPQKSDQLDVKYGLWSDIFLDVLDIHARASQRIVYGPVSFVLKPELLLEPWIGPVWLTRRNPQYWQESEPRRTRWFTSIDDFEQNYKYGDFATSLVVRH